MVKKSILYVVIIFLSAIIVLLLSMFPAFDQTFMGLTPKATYKEYKIYDVIEQKGWPCAEAIEILASDERYDYYFNCLKSDKIYFVSDFEVIKVHEVYNRGIITKEELYELGIINRMVR